MTPEESHDIPARSDSLAQAVLGGVARAVGRPYAAVMRLRRWAYRKGLLASRAAQVPTICVGNLTFGGTGKTPMVAWVVEHLWQLGHRPAILTRGYKSVGGKSDEAEFLRQRTGAAVIVSADRQAGAAAAVEQGASVLVMDDGYQHRRLRRNLDIVLIDVDAPFGRTWRAGACLPFGPMREPTSALRDADAIVMTRTEMRSPGRLSLLRADIERLAPQASIHQAVHRPVRLIDDAGAVLSVEAIAGRKILAFCGIGNPRGFRSTLERIGAEIVGFRRLRDHVKYDSDLLEDLYRLADRHGAELLVTTEKDFVKLAGLSRSRPVWQVAVVMDVVDGEAELHRRIASVAAGR